MSVLRYTFTSVALCRELTIILTLPEVAEDEKLPFKTVVLMPDTKKESDFLLRRESLERYCGSLLATVSLPGYIAIDHSPSLPYFLTQELPRVLAQFPIQPCAFFAEGSTVPSLSGIQNLLRKTYPTLQWDGSVEAFITQMKTQEG